MPAAYASVATPDASRFLFKLCKHFAKKIPVEFDEHHGRAEFAFGACTLSASETELRFDCDSQSDEALARLQSVLVEHLALMTRANPLPVVWTAGARGA
ncbi:DUF2218 domain-containing protein [Jeongeupia chitinilytica]|uniref:DUF2218 domain-containing protein n=1 Tax=Jeongeupia chitinilytica TaxID=1041641 RepID=A0ABQ3GVH8_9NEIS|nr:DUF2218 domain-containing protein [Jeongeupia chitinilytica]GHD56849.1 hypothetical protein GCM10007350_04650 [Jeongeupia chitinilytica]